MPFREDILNPIPGEKPGGEDLRYDPVYDKIKEARREEEDLEQGDWKRAIKLADWPLTAKLCEEVLATRSKDLQVAAWLVEAATRQRGFTGLSEGYSLLQGIVESFWDHLYPELEDGDSEFRATPLEWITAHSILLSRNVSLTKDGYSYFKYKESRDVGYEEQATTDAAKAARKAKLDDNKLAPEAFDESFNQTPKSYYVALDALVVEVIGKVKAFGAVCDEKFGDYSPSVSRLVQALEEIKQVTKSLLDKKRETEPDPIPEEGETPGEGAPGETTEGGESVAAGPTLSIGAFAGTEPGNRKPFVEAIIEAAANLRRLEPTNPGPYLMLRGLRFGELRAAAAKSEMRMLEAPPTELRRQLRVYALDQKWKELLELTEAALGLPSSRAWMDLHRMTCEALIGLGDEYNGVAMGIRSEVRSLVRDVPEIRQAVLMDDTPACNPQTQAWLDDVMDDPAHVAESADSAEAPAPAPTGTRGTPLPWRKKFNDPFRVALESLRRGDKAKALEIMRNEIESQPSGRGKFLRELQVAELCVQANVKEIAQPFLERIKEKLVEFKVTEWEDRALVVQALADLYLYHDNTVESSSDRDQIFQQICRLDPVRALGLRS
jgi:type VI secretion system protein ImpA